MLFRVLRALLISIILPLFLVRRSIFVKTPFFCGKLSWSVIKYIIKDWQPGKRSKKLHTCMIGYIGKRHRQMLIKRVTWLVAVAPPRPPYLLQLPRLPAVLVVLVGLSYLCLRDLPCLPEAWLIKLIKRRGVFSAFRHFDIPAFRCSAVPTFWYADILVFWYYDVFPFCRSGVLSFWQASTLDFARRFQVIARKAAALCPKAYSLFYEHAERSINAIPSMQKNAANILIFVKAALWGAMEYEADGYCMNTATVP